MLIVAEGRASLGEPCREARKVSLELTLLCTPYNTMIFPQRTSMDYQNYMYDVTRVL